MLHVARAMISPERRPLKFYFPPAKMVNQKQYHILEVREELRLMLH